jgi:hypothetical protein
MNADRFTDHLEHVIKSTSCAVVADVVRDAEAGEPTQRPPFGRVRVDFTSGAAIYLSVVGANNNPAGSKANPEVVEGEPLPPVPMPELGYVGGRLRVVDFEGWLTAAMINSGSPEIKSVVQRSTKPTRYTGVFHYGLNIDFYALREAFVSLPWTLRPGETWRNRRINEEQLEEI